MNPFSGNGNIVGSPCAARMNFKPGHLASPTEMCFSRQALQDLYILQVASVGESTWLSNLFTWEVAVTCGAVPFFEGRGEAHAIH